MKHLWLIIIGVLLLSLVGCAPVVRGKLLGTIDGALEVYEDEDNGVMCWVVRGTSGVALDCKSRNELNAKKPAPAP